MATVNRPNLLIKIPGTTQGVDTQSLAKGRRIGGDSPNPSSRIRRPQVAVGDHVPSQIIQPISWLEALRDGSHLRDWIKSRTPSYSHIEGRGELFRPAG